MSRSVTNWSLFPGLAIHLSQRENFNYIRNEHAR